MSVPQPYRSFWNQLLSALMMAVVGAMFYGILAGILTIFVYGLGWVPGSLAGALHGAFESRRTPLRECVVLFVGTFLAALLFGFLGNLYHWDWGSIFTIGLGAPAVGVLLRAGIARLGPVRCRATAMILTGVFFGTSLAVFVLYAYRPID